MGFQFNDEDRIHINLSEYAWSIISEDIFDFCPEYIGKLSGFINDIICNFQGAADASIQDRCDEISSEYEEILSDKSLNNLVDPSVQYTLIDFVTSKLKRRIINTINSYPKGHYKKIKLRNETKALLEDSRNDVYYQGAVGIYIKALMEEYSRLSFNDREKIICKSKINAILYSINNKKQLRIKVRSGKEFRAIPYQIMTDKLGAFSYLVGVDSETKLPVAFRISKSQFKVISARGTIRNEYKTAIYEKLNDSDVSFLSQENTRIVIRLNKYGIQKYNNQIHMRPTYVEKIGSDRFVFNCSVDQIKFYFLKFGSSAVVEEPKDLAKNFRDFYYYAIQAYDPDAISNQSQEEDS